MLRRIVFATSEIYPFSKSGGLGDVMGALPLSIHAYGVPTAVITPFYGRINTSEYPFRLAYRDIPVGFPWEPVTADVYAVDYHGVPVYFIHRAEYFDRRHYYNAVRGDYFDNAERFIFFCRAAAALLERLGEPPSVVHAQDWQTALLPVYIHFWRRQNHPFWSRVSTMFTLHNLAFQGRFSSRLFKASGLPPEAWNMDGVEFYGDLNMLKGGIAYADTVSTVSPSYAREILTEKFGCGLDGILRKKEFNLHGILNGADYHVWEPSTDIFLPATYSLEDIDGKRQCKRALLAELRLDPTLENRPVLGFIGRLRGQKGIDLLLKILPELMRLDVGLIILGEGKKDYEEVIEDLMRHYGTRMCGVVGYTEDLAHRIQAGSDIFLMPSRYEPCGLTQMYALRYGTPPVATAVGGLRDTITPWPNEEATGFIFPDSTTEAFSAAVHKAVELWTTNQEAWQAMMRRAMQQAFTWKDSGKKYIELYRTISQGRP